MPLSAGFSQVLQQLHRNSQLKSTCTEEELTYAKSSFLAKNGLKDFYQILLTVQSLGIGCEAKDVEEALKSLNFNYERFLGLTEFYSLLNILKKKHVDRQNSEAPADVEAEEAFTAVYDAEKELMKGSLNTSAGLNLSYSSTATEQSQRQIAEETGSTEDKTADVSTPSSQQRKTQHKCISQQTLESICQEFGLTIDLEDYLANSSNEGDVVDNVTSRLIHFEEFKSFLNSQYVSQLRKSFHLASYMKRRGSRLVDSARLALSSRRSAREMTQANSGDPLNIDSGIIRRLSKQEGGDGSAQNLHGAQLLNQKLMSLSSKIVESRKSILLDNNWPSARNTNTSRRGSSVNTSRRDMSFCRQKSAMNSSRVAKFSARGNKPEPSSSSSDLKSTSSVAIPKTPSSPATAPTPAPPAQPPIDDDKLRNKFPSSKEFSIRIPSLSPESDALDNKLNIPVLEQTPSTILTSKSAVVVTISEGVSASTGSTTPIPVSQNSMTTATSTDKFVLSPSITSPKKKAIRTNEKGKKQKASPPPGVTKNAKARPKIDLVALAEKNAKRHQHCKLPLSATVSTLSSSAMNSTSAATRGDDPNCQYAHIPTRGGRCAHCQTEIDSSTTGLAYGNQDCSPYENQTVSSSPLPRRHMTAPAKVNVPVRPFKVILPPASKSIHFRGFSAGSKASSNFLNYEENYTGTLQQDSVNSQENSIAGEQHKFARDQPWRIVEDHPDLLQASHFFPTLKLPSTTMSRRRGRESSSSRPEMQYDDVEQSGNLVFASRKTAENAIHIPALLMFYE